MGHIPAPLKPLSGRREPPQPPPLIYVKEGKEGEEWATFLIFAAICSIIVVFLFGTPHYLGGDTTHSCECLQQAESTEVTKP